MKRKRSREEIERIRRKAEQDPWAVKLRALVAKGRAELEAKRRAAEGG